MIYKYEFELDKLSIKMDSEEAIHHKLEYFKKDAYYAVGKMICERIGFTETDSDTKRNRIEVVVFSEKDWSEFISEIKESYKVAKTLNQSTYAYEIIREMIHKLENKSAQVFENSGNTSK